MPNKLTLFYQPTNNNMYLQVTLIVVCLCIVYFCETALHKGTIISTVKVSN